MTAITRWLGVTMTADRLTRPAFMDQTVRVARLAFLAFLAIYGVICLQTPEAGRLLDSVDLAIHETGHFVFAPLGETMGFMGGTILQLLMPTLFAVYFFRGGDRYAGSVCLWWVAQNCWNVSVYVEDARAQELPLVGGGEHDWAYLLEAAGWLERDIALGRAVHTIGIVLFAIALWMGYRAANWMRPAEIGKYSAPHTPLTDRPN